MNKQKGLAPILVVVLLAVAIIGGYLIYQQQTKTTIAPQVAQPSSAPVSTSSATNSAETANWKTYTSPNNLYSFRYPVKNWEINQSISPLGNEISIYCINNCFVYSVDRFTVSLVTSKSVDEYINSIHAGTDDFGFIKFTLNGDNAIKVGFGGSSQSPAFINVFVMHNGQGYLIQSSYAKLSNLNNLDQFPNPKPDFLPTFKFTQ